MTYLKWQDAAAWMACAGRPALEESERVVPDDVPALSKPERAALEARRTALEGATAVDILPLQSLPVGQITGERGAQGWGSLILADYPDHATLEVYPPDRLLGVAALVKYAILHDFRATNVGSPEELFGYAAQVTEAAQLSLNLRASITALEHLVPGDYCANCRAAYRCPALAGTVHATVFGPLQAPDDPEAVPVPLATSREALAPVIAKLPLIDAWVAAVKQALGIKQGVAVSRRRRRKKSARRERPDKPRDDA